MQKNIAVILLLFTIELFSQATRLIGPPGGRVEKISIHPNNPSIVYAAEYNGGIYRTDDGGETTNAVETYFKDFRQQQSHFHLAKKTMSTYVMVALIYEVLTKVLLGKQSVVLIKLTFQIFHLIH